MFIHDRFPSLLKLVTEPIMELCNSVFSAITFSSTNNDIDLYSDSYQVLTLLAINYYFFEKDSFFIGGGIGPNLFYDNTNNEFHFDIHFAAHLGFRFFNDSGLIVKPVIKVGLPFDYSIESYNSAGLLGEPFFLLSFFIGFLM